MDHPITLRSKPLENKFSGISSAHATDDTIRRCPCKKIEWKRKLELDLETQRKLLFAGYG